VRWVFGSFVEADGVSTVDAWYGAKSSEVRAAFDMALRHLRDQPPSNWVRPFVGSLKRECSGLVEIRFKAGNIQHRPIGFYGPNRMQFTILEFAIEKDRKFVPASVCRTALRKKSEVISDPKRVAEYDPGD